MAPPPSPTSASTPAGRRASEQGLPTRSRLIAIVGILLLLGFVATNLVSYRVSTATLKATILQNELPLTSSNIYSEMQADLLRPVFVSSLMANDTFVKDWLLGGERDVGSIRRYLDEIRRKYDVFTAFVISDRTHNYYHYTGIPYVVSESDPQNKWFFRVRAMTAPYEVNVDLDKALDNELTVFVNYRVLDYQGNFLAVAGVGLKLTSVADILSRFRSDGRRNIYFVRPDGSVVARSEGAAVQEANIRNAPGIAAIADDLLAGGPGYYEYNRADETMLVTTRPAPEIGWTVIVEQKESDALQALRSGLLTNLLIGTSIILLTSLAIAYAISGYQSRLEELASTDRLTGLANRQALDMVLDQAIRQFRRAPRPAALILFDIDHFKSINDRLGHLRGDEVIRRVADIARGVVRDADLLCRWGGEELLVLAFDCRLAGGTEIAEKLRRAIAEASFAAVGEDVTVTVSCGVAEMMPGDTADTLVDRADAALYRAKQNGRNRVEIEEVGTQAPVA
jgi:diguanylate cyclase (GGDEF)-like protein